MPSKTAIAELQQRIALFEDMDAYKELYRLYFDGLQRFAYSFVKSSEVAEEIVSDVFIKIWQIRNRLTEIDNLQVYLYTIARNFSINYIQRTQKIRHCISMQWTWSQWWNLETPKKFLSPRN